MHAHTAYKQNERVRQQEPSAAPRATVRSLAERRSAELRRLQRQRYAKRIWPLGERVEFELVEKFIRHFGLDEDEAGWILDQFAGLDLGVLQALGADELPSPPIHQVRR